MGQRAEQNRRRTEELPKLPRDSYFSMAGLYGRSAPDMHSLRLIVVSVQLLCYLLLCPVDATSHRKPTSVSTMLPPSELRYQMPTTSDPLSCQMLLPKSLPGFTHMPPVSKFLVGLALRNALEEAGCQADVRALQLQLYQLGGVKATQALIHHLQELQKGGHADRNVSVDALFSALQHLSWEQSGPKRVRRWISNKDCENEREQRVHNVVDLLPAVGTYYNLGTALYYAIKNCSDKAKERGRDGAIDLGYDLLMAMVGASGGPAGVAITAALKPVMKAGVQRLIRSYYNEKEVTTPQPEVYYYDEKEVTTPQPEVYYYNEKEVTTPQPEVTTPQPETGKDSTTYSNDVEESTMSNLLSEVDSTTSNWEWPLLNNFVVLAYKR
ncbi:apolipoprotein F [Grammomys surdaster]|uniref:apolipoprotein F n=1 Tax=Grammomys surdaster TaxID=491861 RepID=UPI00109EE78C|nr:apolipoprotein F [Grammomys surdaster]